MARVKFTRSVLIGAFSGTIATIPMTAAMEAVRYWLFGAKPETFPPRQVARAMVERAGLKEFLRPFGEPGLVVFTAATHLGFGTVAGGLYGALEPLINRRESGEAEVLTHSMIRKGDLRAAVAGVGFGMLVWTGSYFGWLPALGVVKPQGDHPLRKNAVLGLSHVVWGAALGVMCHRLQQRDRN